MSSRTRLLVLGGLLAATVLLVVVFTAGGSHGPSARERTALTRLALGASAAQQARASHRPFGTLGNGGGSTTGKVENLGAITGATATLDLKKASFFTAELEHNVVFKVANAPVGEQQFTLVAKEITPGGFTFSIESLEWIGTEPTFSTVTGKRNIVAAVAYESGGAEKLLGAGTVAPAVETKHLIIEHTWVFPGVVEEETLPGFFFKLAAGEKQKVLAERCKTTKGEITVNVRKEGTEVKGLKKVVTSTASEAAPEATTEPAAGEYVDLKLTAKASTPENLSCSLMIEHIVKE